MLRLSHGLKLIRVGGKSLLARYLFPLFVDFFSLGLTITFLLRSNVR